MEKPFFVKFLPSEEEEQVVISRVAQHLTIYTPFGLDTVKRAFIIALTYGLTWTDLRTIRFNGKELVRYFNNTCTDFKIVQLIDSPYVLKPKLKQNATTI